MMNNIEVLKQIELMGGRVIATDNGWNHFLYQRILCVHIPDVGGGAVRFVIPHLAKLSDYQKERVELVINETNREVKFVKAVILDNGSISMSYDHKLTAKDDVGTIVPHMVATLYAASDYLTKKLEAM